MCHLAWMCFQLSLSLSLVLESEGPVTADSGTAHIGHETLGVGLSSLVLVVSEGLVNKQCWSGDLSSLAAVHTMGEQGASASHLLDWALTLGFGHVPSHWALELSLFKSG